jgi:hypothetical protein
MIGNMPLAASSARIPLCIDHGGIWQQLITFARVVSQLAILFFYGLCFALSGGAPELHYSRMI